MLKFKKVFIVISFLCFMLLTISATLVSAKGLEFVIEKDGKRSHKGRVDEIERISLNPTSSLSLFSNGKTYFIYSPNGIHSLFEKTQYLSMVYENILRSDEITIQHVQYGVHRKVINFILFKN